MSQSPEILQTEDGVLTPTPTVEVPPRPAGRTGRRRRRRHALMGWLAAGLGVAALNRLDTQAAQAASGDPVLAGQIVDATAPTRVRNSVSYTPDSTADGVQGYAAGGNNSGLFGRNNDTNGIGISGAAPSGTGVFGESSNGFGVGGKSSSGQAVRGESTSSVGVYGKSTSSDGVYGDSSTGAAVRGASTSGVGGAFAGGQAAIRLTPAASGIGAPTTGTHQIGELYVDSVGGLFYCIAAGTPGTWARVITAGAHAVLGSVTLADPAGGTFADLHTSGNSTGLRFYAADTLTGTPAGAALQFWGNSTALPGQIYLDGGASSAGHIIFRTGSSGPSTRMYVDAGGTVVVLSSLYAPSKSFMIDHPLDPENRLLYHACVEAPEPLNIYSGNVTTDPQGNATVQLPDYFEALNRDFRYHFTVVGQFAQVMVASKVQNRRFTLRTDKPNVEVSWLVIGERNDAYTKANPFVAERPKSADDRGTYLRPQDFGQPETRGWDWRHRPERQTSGSQQLAPPAAPPTGSPSTPPPASSTPRP